MKMLDTKDFNIINRNCRDFRKQYCLGLICSKTLKLMAESGVEVVVE